MMKPGILTALSTLAFLSTGIFVPPAFSDIAIAPETCLKCHHDQVEREAFAASVHGNIACTACHVPTTNLSAHIEGKVKGLPVNCVPCHKPEAAEHFTSIHMLEGIDCVACHSEIHRLRAWSGKKQVVVETCLGCHEAPGYRESVHGRSIAAGNDDSAACNDCHNLHAIKAVSGLDPKAYRGFHTAVCIPCHSDREKMVRNGVTPNAVATFIESYHGKNYRLGFPEHAAGCADCHTSHHVLPEEDPDSTLNPANRLATCSQCHPNATPLFTRFYAHGDFTDRQNYPILYWTYVAMTVLVVGVFALFWVHTLLWMFRGFVENREKERELGQGECHPLPDGHRQYRRFRGRYIVFHLFVIVSFLGLSLTGLPLKFSDQEWARTMMSFYGGVQQAGLIHRACAVLTFYYFIGALLCSAEYLFSRRQGGTFFSRLFGPDSLMPNRKDLQDIQGMVRWFLFRGPKPDFERWTYWEKFDFFAVFWGMFAIGGSGLMLWFPEFFGSFLPGWILNVATIIHSEEALLATGFIFTVHFFNTHGRPEKFPMDFVIFNGQISKAEMIEERGAQWQRYKETDTTEEFSVRKPSSIAYDFILKGFGFLALFTGMALAFMMVYAFIRG